MNWKVRVLLLWGLPTSSKIPSVGSIQELSHLVSNYKRKEFHFKLRCKSYKRSKWRFSFSLINHTCPRNYLNHTYFLAHSLSPSFRCYVARQRLGPPILWMKWVPWEINLYTILTHMYEPNCMFLGTSLVHKKIDEHWILMLTNLLWIPKSDARIASSLTNGRLEVCDLMKKIDRVPHTHTQVKL